MTAARKFPEYTDAARTDRARRHALIADKHLNKFIAETNPDATRPEALRIAFRDWAIGNGYLKDA